MFLSAWLLPSFLFYVDIYVSECIYLHQDLESLIVVSHLMSIFELNQDSFQGQGLLTMTSSVSVMSSWRPFLGNKIQSLKQNKGLLYHQQVLYYGVPHTSPISIPCEFPWNLLS